MTRTRHNATQQAQVLGLLIALLAAPVTAQAQDLSSQEVERILREKPALLNEQGEPIERRLDPESYVPNELIVRFRSGSLTLPQGQHRAAPAEVAARSEITALLSSSGVAEVRKVFRNFRATDTLRTLRSGEQVRVPDLSQVFVLEFAAPVDVPALIEQFEALPEVLYAEPNILYEASVVPPDAVPVSGPYASTGSPVVLTPNDPQYGEQWALEQTAPYSDEDIDAETAWNYETGDYGVKVGIIDSGINYNHQDLGAAYGLGYKVVGGYDWWSSDSDPMDQTSHGSHVAGIAGALTNNTDSGGSFEGIAGVAGGWGYNRQTGSGNKGAQLFALRFLGPGGGDAADAADAIVEGADPDGDGWGYGLDVLNNSWGCSGAPADCYNETVRSAVNYAARMNRVFVAAKGNADSGDLHYPSDYDGSWVISVGATTRDGRRATPADWGYDIYGNPYGSNYGNGIDVAAPGTAILSTVLGQSYDSYNGTSMATPHVSGLAALLIGEARSQGLTLHPEDVQGLIRASVEDKGASGYDDQFGAGRINAGQALARLRPPYALTHSVAFGGSVVGSTGAYAASLLNSVTGSAGVYLVKRYEVRKTVSFPGYTDAALWCRGANESIGWSAANPNYQAGWCEVLSSTQTSATIRTYVYQVWEIDGDYLGYYPATPQSVRFEYTRVGIPPPLNAGISGPTSLPSGQSGTWTSSTSGGQHPYSYLWEYRYPCPVPPPPPPPCAPLCRTGSPSSTGGALRGRDLPPRETCGQWLGGSTGFSFTKTFTESTVTIRLTVTDAASTVDTATRAVTLTGGARTAEGTAGEAQAAAQAQAGEPYVFALAGAQPNPFGSATAVRFTLPEASEVRVVVYDLLGREVARLADGYTEAGPHERRFDASALPSGVYVVRLVAGGLVATERVTLLK